MSEIRHRDRILEAIDQLRKRKARPDVNRICSFMFRRFAVSCIETKLDLQKLIDAEIVIKVDYKGSTSYRNASKWAMLPSYKYKKEIDTSSLISSAVAELIVLEPDYLDIGVPEFELEAHLIEKDSRRFSKKNLENILKKEVEQRTLVKLENGNYFLGEHSSSTMDRPSASRVGSTGKNSTKQKLASARQARLKRHKFIDKQNDNSNDSDKMKPDDQSNTSEGANVGFRVGGRQKRARIVFDPSDNNLPTRVNKKRGPGRPLGSLNKSTVVNNNNNSTLNSSTGSAPSTPTTATTPTSQIKTTSTLTPLPQRVNAGVQVKPFNKHSLESSSPPPNPSLCFVCHSYGTRIKGVPERLITCADCTTKAHPSCVENSNDVQNQNGWHCGKCNSRFCVVCELKIKDPAGGALCANCQDCYHIQCHTPPIPEKVRTKQIPWLCCKCVDSANPQPPPLPLPPQPSSRFKEPVHKEPAAVKEKENSISPLKKECVPEPPITIPEPKPRNVPANCLHDPFEDIPIDESIPDAKHWTVNQVYQYFSTQLKPEWAQAIKDQDIDGQALLLMKRMDILTGLNLKLGPALKVYGHIRKLQTRKSHLRILWS